MLTRPEAPAEESPDSRTTEPLLPAEGPERNSKRPLVEDFEAPVTTDTAPEEATDAPDERRAPPLEPNALEPVEKLMLPLTPEAVLPVSTTALPLAPTPVTSLD